MVSNALYWHQFLLVAGLHLLAVASPGPDFAVTLRTSLVYPRRTAILCALGIGLGIGVHVFYCLVGIGLVISKSILLFNALKFAASGYLIWVGFQAIRAKCTPLALKTDQAGKDLTPARAIGLGFLTNALNPKATLFFLALFTSVIEPGTPVGFQLLYGAEMMVATFVWFAFVAYGLSAQVVRDRFVAVRHWIDRTMGVVLIALGIKVATATRN